MNSRAIARLIDNTDFKGFKEAIKNVNSLVLPRLSLLDFQFVAICLLQNTSVTALDLSKTFSQPDFQEPDIREKAFKNLEFLLRKKPRIKPLFLEESKKTQPANPTNRFRKFSKSPSKSSSTQSTHKEEHPPAFIMMVR